MDLLAVLARPEGKTIEFKRDLSSPAGFLRTVTAFANTAGGAIVIGVEDRTRHIVGVGNPLDLEERAANLISDSISPRLVPEIEVLCYRACARRTCSPERRSPTPRGAAIGVGHVRPGRFHQSSS